jgi:ribonuclease VapC
MFIDASALVSILRREGDSAMMQARIAAADGPRYVSAVVRFEAVLAVARALSTLPNLADMARSELLREARSLVNDYLNEIGADDIAIDSAISNAAIDAAATYGKVVGHKAGLNMGDCFAYACAKSVNVPLLYKGNNFSETDLA